MAVGGLDIQLLVQSLLYFTGCLAGLAAAVPMGLTSMDFGGNCILYGTIKWQNATYFTYTFGGKSLCDFPIYLIAFGCILYAAGMGGYHLYAVCRSLKDPTIGSQMWVMPFLMMNILLTVLLFVASCVVSVGFVSWCNGFVNGAKDAGNKRIKSCSDGQTITRWDMNGQKYDGSSYYTFLSTAQTAAWICFLIWVAQVSLCALRFWRNRRVRSTGAQIQTENDKQVIATVEPTA